jgi:hypothetical protein
MQHISILKPEIISKGLSVCRLNSGNVAISVHYDEQRIIIELSEAEFSDFVKESTEFMLSASQTSTDRQ